MGKLLTSTSGRDTFDLANFESRLNKAHQQWEARKRQHKAFTRLPRWQYWLLGGSLTEKVLVVLEDLAEGWYWSIEIEFH